jgi:hypothetical protein
MMNLCVYNTEIKKEITVKVNQNIIMNLLYNDECACHDAYMIIDSIMIGKYIYIFIQLNKKKTNLLYVLNGQVENHIVLDESLNIQMYYDLYNLCKNSDLCCHVSTKLKVKRVIYNIYDNIFVILFGFESKTLFGKLDYLSSIHSVGTAIELVKSGCELLVINHIPLNIIVLSHNKYEVSVFNEHKKMNRIYGLCF